MILQDNKNLIKEGIDLLSLIPIYKEIHHLNEASSSLDQSQNLYFLKNALSIVVSLEHPRVILNSIKPTILDSLC